MNLLVSSIPIPKIQLQYIKDGKKLFRIYSSDVDPLFEQLILNKNIRAQIWLEREVKKQSGNRTKRSWVHSADYSNKKPARLFTGDEYNYGAGSGWGWKGTNAPSYTTTNGIVPTEFEITSDNIKGNSLTLHFPAVDIFSNILKTIRSGTSAKDGDPIKSLAIISRGRASYQLIRARLVINHQGKVIMGEPTEPMIIGIHRERDRVFRSAIIESFIKIGRFI